VRIKRQPIMIALASAVEQDAMFPSIAGIAVDLNLGIFVSTRSNVRINLSAIVQLSYCDYTSSLFLSSTAAPTIVLC
jgi:hypothetical protein